MSEETWEEKYKDAVYEIRVLCKKLMWLSQTRDGDLYEYARRKLEEFENES